MTRRLLNYIFLVVVAPLILAAASGRILILLHDHYLTSGPDDEMEKPLPNLPNSARVRKVSSSLALTIDARAHLHRFISRALDEEGDIRDRETWAEKVETSLDELGASLARGGWLPGLKRGRYVRRRHHEEEEKRRADEQSKRDKEAEEHAKNRTTKGRSKLKESIVEDGHVEDKPDNEQRNASLEELRGAASKPFLPTPKPSVKHLLLTVAGPPTSEPAEDMGFKLVRSAVHCSFKPGEFFFPKSLSTTTTDATVLYGLDDWDACLLSTDDPLQVVGGTFHLKGLSSLAQYHALCRVLCTALYTYLSLVLEQDLLANSHVDLRYPKPTIPHLPSFPTTVERSSSSPDVKDKGKRDSGSGLWLYLSKKTEDLIHRASHVAPAMPRRGSIDFGFGQRLPRHTSLPDGPDGGFLARRLSLLSTVSSRASEDSNDSGKPIYAVAVRRLDSWKDLLSTSPGVVFNPPKFLLAISELEAKDPGRRLVGDEKAALTSLLGYHGKESLSRGIVGMHGFVRHQGFAVLYSEHVPGTSTSSLMSPPPTPSKSDTSSDELQLPLRIACGGHRRKWLHYRYYQHGKQWDETLGEAVVRWCSTAEDPCMHPDCHFQRADHDMRWIHGGTRVIATVSLPTSSEASTSDDLIRMWQTCAICGKETSREVIRDGTYLSSFAKYLELLVYSPAVHNLQPSLCEHTAYPAKPWSGPNFPLPQARFNIIRHFSHQSRTVTLTLSEVKEIFEVCVPRLQILRRKVAEKKPVDVPQQDLVKVASPPGEAHRTLRREIMRWWQGLSEHIDELEDKFVADHPSAFHKTLPRLPSTDDAFEDEDGGASRTPTIRPGAPPSTPLTPRGVSAISSSYPFLATKRSNSSLPSEPVSASTSVLTTSTAATEVTVDSKESLHLLAGLRHKFQRTEQELYVELARTPEKSLNDIRRSFVTSARGATRRLAAWEKKHASQQPSTSTSNESSVAPEPEWWQSGCHAVPGGNIIVREDDWGSIIAFTLSTADYQRELSNMNSTRSTAPAAPPATPTSTRPPLFRAGESFRRFVSGSVSQQPDPDYDDAGWQEPETYSAVISRKEHPRDPVSLMSIRDVLRQKASADAGTSSSLLSPTGTGSGKSSGTETPRSVRAKPAVEVSTAAAGGQVSGMPEAVEAAGKILHELEAVSQTDQSRTSLSHSRHSSSGFVETNIRRGKASSIMSDSDGSTIQESVHGPALPPPLPPKDRRSSDTEESAQKNLNVPTPDEPPATPTKSSIFTVPFANSLTSAMRYVLKPGEAPRPSTGTAHHNLLHADAPSIDERPHIKYDWTIGKRLRFSCTVYYAKQFDQLRRRCGVDEVFLKSMARSENWAAEGGKSRSNFWKTTDNRFIIKTLVNAWNVADLQVLIDLGPSYFKYMEATASRPTVLAKLLGFYTVEIRNLETGAPQAKADLLVMENLFYDRKITKTFDLKGIQGRKVKASSGSGSKTLFDGEWIEGQQRALTLVRPHSKVVLQEAIKADCEFLAKSNIMDYSLLLGIDEEKKQMVCGLVDTIGSYTFAKTLEYKAKQGLNSGKEVTVVPPNEYQERFVSAMDDYFLACPDKWSRPLDNTPVPSDYRDLPSVL